VFESFVEQDVEVLSVLGDCLILQLIEYGCCCFKVMVACECVVRAM
jgi:hypothetical protein